jgi:hypothetical protein
VPTGKQRIYPRYVAELPVEIITQAGALAATSVDLSMSGMRVRTDTPLAFGDRLTLRFRIPGLEQDTEVDGTVRWVDGTQAGVQFGSLRAMDVWGLNRLFRSARPR